MNKTLKTLNEGFSKRYLQLNESVSLLPRGISQKIISILENNFSNLGSDRDPRTELVGTNKNYDSSNYRISVQGPKRLTTQSRNDNIIRYRFIIYSYTQWFYPKNSKAAKDRSVQEIKDLLDSNSVNYEDVYFDSYSTNPYERAEGRHYNEALFIEFIQPRNVDKSSSETILNPIISYLEKTYNMKLNNDIWSYSGKTYSLIFVTNENYDHLRSKIRKDIFKQFSIKTRVYTNQNFKQSNGPDTLIVDIIDPMDLGLEYNTHLMD